MLQYNRYQKIKKDKYHIGQSSLKNLRMKSNRILKTINSNSNHFDDVKIEQQIKHEIASIQSILNQYQDKLMNYSITGRNKNSVQQILSIEEIILTKDEQLKELTEQIKFLKMAKYKEEVNTSKSKTSDHIQMFKLAQELKSQKNDLNHLIEQHYIQIQKIQIFSKKLERQKLKYYQKCKEKNWNIVSYEQFKEKIEQIRRIENQNKRKSSRFPSIRERIEINFEISNPKSSNIFQKNMKDLQNKKLIAETALKNSKKKHLSEIYDLNNKLEFLRDEDALLSQKLKQKELEKDQLQFKFNHNFHLRQKNKHSLYVQSPQKTQYF